MSPRLPVTGAQELRITLGGTERRLLEDLAVSYRIQTLSKALTSGDLTILEILSDWQKVMALTYGVAVALEVFGIETGLPTPIDALEFLQALKIGPEGGLNGEGTSVWDLLVKLWTGELGGYPGGY